MRYLKFNFQHFVSEKDKHSLIERFLGKILSFILPKANPDYEDKIDDAIYWLIEFDEESVDDGDIPNREIGLDENYKPILKMPYKKNYGYWLDTNMTYPDFIERFNAESIDEKCFDEKWDELI